MRYRHPEVLQVLDPRPILERAATLFARFNDTGWFVAETSAAGSRNGGTLWFGDEQNVGRPLKRAAEQRSIEIHVIEAAV